MFELAVREQKPAEYTLTRIIDDFNFSQPQIQPYTNILKNYVYVPEKKVIA